MRKLAIERVLCPIDPPGQVPSSLVLGAAVARARRAELRVLHVVAPADAADAARPALQDRERILLGLRESLADAAPGYDFVGAAVRAGDPALQVLRFARRMVADLIVMGAPGADRPERPIGPVATVVVARSQCPVLTVPAHPEVRMDDSGLFRRIVCAVDLTPSSVPVLRQALSLGWESGGRLVCVCVVPEHEPAPSDAAERLQAALPEEAAEWCDIASVVTNGSPGIEVVRVAEAEQADVVVIGAPRRWTSTTHAALLRSLCPVLVTHDARPLPWPPATAGGRSAATSGAGRR